jgi:hypothetical protein
MKGLPNETHRSRAAGSDRIGCAHGSANRQPKNIGERGAAVDLQVVPVMVPLRIWYRGALWAL